MKGSLGFKDVGPRRGDRHKWVAPKGHVLLKKFETKTDQMTETLWNPNGDDWLKELNPTTQVRQLGATTRTIHAPSGKP